MGSNQTESAVWLGWIFLWVRQLRGTLSIFYIAKINA